MRAYCQPKSDQYNVNDNLDNRSIHLLCNLQHLLLADCHISASISLFLFLSFLSRLSCLSLSVFLSFILSYDYDIHVCIHCRYVRQFVFDILLCKLHAVQPLGCHVDFSIKNISITITMCCTWVASGLDKAHICMSAVVLRCIPKLCL